MKLNGINKLYIAIGIAMIGLNVYRVIHYRAWDRYYYFTNICAPPAYPVYVRDAYFIVANRDELGSIRYEEVNHFNTSWKESYYFPETYEKELLPQKLVLKYASYRDQQFYRDTIDLPADTIRLLVDKIVEEKKAPYIYYRGRDVPGLTFLIGIANGGHILVWLRGVEEEHLILQTNIKPVTPDKEDTYYGEPMTPAVYLKDRFMGLDDSLKARIDRGWEAGANYRDSL